jgi:signal recognition particle receptor subunit beta
MPTFDTTQGLLVIRIVYDGPALSGKTTSLKALAQGVASQLESPEERDGRTLYFDWMEYVGGLFEGRQIRCQIVSVPGQSELAHRRQRLLETADAVVCVLDTRRPELEFGLSWLYELTPQCRVKTPPVGIVLQANKRDASDAVPRDELRTRVNQIAPIAIVESVATAADGIREAFVLSVRLALDRVRALSAEGRLQEEQTAQDGAAQLLQSLRDAELTSELVLPQARVHRPSDPVPATLHMQHDSRPPAAPDPDAPERVFVPDPLMPGGMIWPPVDGRALLHEVAGLAIRPARTARGDWWGSGAGWRFHSSPRSLYDDPNAARTELIGWARLHSANAAQVSAGRAVILADAGNGRLRLWQLVRVESALRERLDGALSGIDAKAVSEGLLEVTTQLLAAREWFAAGTLPLPCTLWTVGSTGTGRPRFVGLMPALASPVHNEPEPRALLERELTPHLRELRRARVDYIEVIREIWARAERTPPGSPARKLGELLQSLD